ncbi:MAG: DUF4160 domain-containing protein [Firmicutes bacterium]|nr:DUF4160 domain-containing protein [Bacillota bacterium]
MPALSMFFGLVVYMYYAPKEHNPPHIHVEYQGQDSTFSILDGNLIDGELSQKHIRLVQAWMEIHKEELIANWDLCQNGKEPFRIEPLK